MEGKDHIYPNEIRRLRKEAGLKQTELSKLLKFSSSSSLSDLEAGRSLPSFVTSLRLQRIFKRLISDIYPELDERYAVPAGREYAKLVEKRIGGRWQERKQ